MRSCVRTAAEDLRHLTSAQSTNHRAASIHQPCLDPEPPIVHPPIQANNHVRNDKPLPNKQIELQV